jgi:hypothetical protein
LGSALFHRGQALPGAYAGIGAALGALGGAVFGVRYKRGLKEYQDERLVAHRSHASRWAAFTGVLIMSGWLIVDYTARHLVRWDLIVIMGAMAVTQWIALFVYGKKN